MARTGPQNYPGADQSRRYQATYPGDAMEVNVVVLHTTEGRSLPGYGGGATAPNLTAVPDFAAKKLKWYQHFDIDTSSRALRNLAGGVDTNTLNVVQVELVGTCDPKTHAKWKAAGDTHIFWPEAPDWALAEVAEFLAWMHAQHGVPLTGPAKWPAYPTSYANGGGQRMTNAQWTAFEGVCGHMHAPENLHGDPGAINFGRLIKLATAGNTQEEDVPLSTDDINKVASATAAKLIAGGGVLEATDVTRVATAVVAALKPVEAAQSATIDKLVSAVATLAANIGDLDPAAIVAELKTSIEAIDVSFSVSTPTS